MNFTCSYDGINLCIQDSSLVFPNDPDPDSLLSFVIRNFRRTNDSLITCQVSEQHPLAASPLTETICAFLKHLHERLNITVTKSTLLRFQQTYHMIMKFEKDLRRVFRTRDLSMCFLENFIGYMKRKGYKPNTIHIHIRNLQKIEAYACDYKRIPVRETASYHFHVPQTPMPHLLMTDIKKMEAYHPENKKYALSKLLFLFQCYTGLSYTDLEALNESNFEKTGSNTVRLVYRRKKNGKRCIVPLLKEAIILRKQLIILSASFKRRKPETVFDVPVCQNYNQFLKIIARELGLNVHISSHTARRTFATTIALTHGASLSQTATLLGHSKLRDTVRYASVTNEKLEREFRPLLNADKKKA